MSEAVINKIDPEGYKDIKEYLQSINTTGEIRVGLNRLKPTHWGANNTQIKGHLANFDEPISEEEIRDQYGGGTYLLKISGPGKDGRLVYFTNKTLHIAGDPKMPHGVADAANDAAVARAQPENPSVQIAAMDAMKSMVDRSFEQKERPGHDAALQAVIAGLQADTRDLRVLLEKKDERLLELATAKPERSSSDELLGRVLEGESARIMALRTQHDSETAAMRERLAAELDRANASHERALERAEDSHKRELQLLQMTFEGRIQALQAAHQSESESYKRELQNTGDGYKRELSMIHAQYQEAKAELAALKLKKDKSPVESLQEMAALKDAFDSIGGGNAEETPKGKFESVLEGLAPAIEAISGRIATAAAPPPPAAPPAPPAPVFQQLPDGRVVARKADGSVHEVRQRQKVKTESGVELPEIPAGDLALAIMYLENSARNDTEPAQFVKGIVGTVPGNITLAIRELGVDRFLTEVAKVPASSPLRATASGRNWIREVGRLLVEEG